MKEKEILFNENQKRTVSLHTRCRDERSSEEEHRADALALGAEERRDKLRKAAGRSKYPESRGCLNGETRIGRTLCIHM